MFPPIHIGAPAAAAGWYLDGGIRLNAPLKPALALGADAIAVVATHPVSDTVAPAPANQSPPDVDDVVVWLMAGAVVDRMVEDVRMLAKVNSLVESSTGDTPGGRPRIVIPASSSSRQNAILAQLAVQVFDGGHHNRRGINRRLRSAELSILGRMVGVDGPRRGDLFSYLYFDSEFIESSIARQDAAALFEGCHRMSCRGRSGPSNRR